jgi:hypothetical protein
VNFFVRLIIAIVVLLSTPRPAMASDKAQPLASLQSYTGLWQMPNARVLPDWAVRLKHGYADPYHYYGGALGVFDRLELHGQFTRIETIQAFIEDGYGDYVDRSAGARLVLLKEGELLPKVAVGFFDATGTALFASRYLVASKMLGPFDLTFGLGQGILAGEFVPDEYRGSEDIGFEFLFSSPFRKTRPFGGIEWHATEGLTLSLEYSSLELSNMFGYRDGAAREIQEDDSRWPVNVGLKYKLTDKIHAQLACLGGTELGGGVSFELPLEPEGFLPWKKEEPFEAGERLKWQAFGVDNEGLARIMADALNEDGFGQVSAAASDSALWLEASNRKYLSDARAFARMAAISLAIVPERIERFYFNLRSGGQVLQSLSATRGDLKAFLESRMDKETFLTFSSLELHGSRHWDEFRAGYGASALQRERDPWYGWEINPRLKTFLNNRRGFFKHKGVVQLDGYVVPWPGAQLAGQLELTLFNEFDELDFGPLEPEATRTDMILYEERSDPRITQLALDQLFPMPWDVQGRVAAGYFESAYAGVGGEVFRYFLDGRFGLGLQGEVVRKRDIEDNFGLRDDVDRLYHTGFVNLYGYLWPDYGIEAGLKVGRFLAGDLGARIELRRSYNWFTIGAWYTRTDTDVFESEENRGASEKGVYIAIPLGLFRDRDDRGHLTYTITSFTRDQGQTVRQPRSLYPLNPWSTPAHTRHNLDDMRLSQ